nr:14323_t:CDS:1 [Entrophospora candida]
MLPPPIDQFSSYDELLAHVRAFVLTQGYAVTIKRTRTDVNGKVKNVTLCCDRGGSYRNSLNLTDDLRCRQTASRLLDCPFELHGTRRNGVWFLEVRNSEHNHEASEDMSGHPIARRLNTEQRELVQQMSAAGSHPREILSTIHQSDLSSMATSRTIYNTLHSIREERLDGRTPIQALFDKLQESDFEFDYQRDHQNHITHLFFAHRISIALTRTYPVVLLLDCTYKTNRYRMPLLNVVGMTSFNTTFFSCFAFLKDEKEADYEWALTCISKIFNGMSHPKVIVTDRELALMNAIGRIFPGAHHLLCIWHINKNILAKCKRHFATEEDWTEFIELWKAVTASITEQDFTTKWNEFLECYASKPNVLQYLQETWILHKECFISAWVDRYLHLGNKATSRVEGAHATLKKYLQSSRGDLESVHRKIILQVESQAKEIRAMISSERLKVQHVYRIALFEPLLSRVSVFALKKIRDEWIKASNATLDSPLNPCSGILSSTMGLPCSHLISERIANSQTLQQTDIHEHWWIKGCHFEFLGDLTRPANGDHANLQLLLQSFAQQYQFWPPHQQAAARTQLEELSSAPPDVLGNPEVSRPRGRPVGARNQSEGSMQRDPSAFELVERRPRQCGICRQTGHNSQTCPTV